MRQAYTFARFSAQPALACIWSRVNVFRVIRNSFPQAIIHCLPEGSNIYIKNPVYTHFILKPTSERVIVFVVWSCKVFNLSCHWYLLFYDLIHGSFFNHILFPCFCSLHCATFEFLVHRSQSSKLSCAHFRLLGSETGPLLWCSVDGMLQFDVFLLRSCQVFQIPLLVVHKAYFLLSSRLLILWVDELFRCFLLSYQEDQTFGLIPSQFPH